MRKTIALTFLALSLAVVAAREAKADFPYDGVASTATYYTDDGTTTTGYTVLTAATEGTLGVDPATMMPVFKPYVFVFVRFIGPSPVDPTHFPTGTTYGPPPTGVMPFDYDHYWFMPPTPEFPYGIPWWMLLSDPWM